MIRAFVLFASLGSAGLWPSCQRTSHPPPIDNPGAAQEGLPVGRVVLLSPSGPDVTVQVEVARSDAEREKGLMFRRSLAPDAGMLFIFDGDQQLEFWMKNTYIPLDMIFINHGMAVAGIVENAEPESTNILGIHSPSQYVLEVNAGFARAHGIVPGTKVRFVDVATP